MSTSDPAVLVTGGAGYIGSHACKALSHAGYTPVAYDSLERGHAWAAQWGPLETGDIGDIDRLGSVFAAHRPIAVMHFAAYAYVGESVAEPGRYYANNVLGTLTLLDTMRRFGVDRLVFSSTCATYGTPDTLPVAEDHPQNPINPYGRSKLMIERILRDLGAAHDLRSVTLRYFNAAGADPDGDIGEAHDPEPHLVPRILRAAAGLEPHVPINGTDYPTPDGTCIRDYVHVTDLADAHVRALEHLNRGAPPDIFNLGTGHGCSIHEVIRQAEAATGRTIPLALGARRIGDPAALVADPRRAMEVLGWHPQYSAMPTILRTAWNWMMSGRPQTG